MTNETMTKDFWPDGIRLVLSVSMQFEEAGHRRRMMLVSAHDRISGSPQMVRAWDEFLRYAKGRPGVTFLRKDEIARYALESRLTLREYETI